MWSKSHMILRFADPYRKPPPCFVSLSEALYKRMFSIFHLTSRYHVIKLSLDSVNGQIPYHKPPPCQCRWCRDISFFINHVTSHDHVITGTCKVLRSSPLSKATTLPSLIDWPNLLDIKFFLLYRTFSLRQ